MGSRGSQNFFSVDKNADKIVEEIRRRETQALNDSYNSKVANVLNEALSEFNDRDVEKTQQHLDTIEKAIHNDIDGTIELRYAGSVAKHTYVDGLSDIDCLAILNNSELLSKSPTEVKEYFKEMLVKRLPNTDVTIGKLAVSVNFSDGFQIQLLPTIKKGDGIKIPSSKIADSWSNIVKPDKFVLALRYSNIQMSGKLIPVIKLAKSIIASFPDKGQLSGYHVEALAIEAFQSYKGEKRNKDMLKYFFEKSSKVVLSPIKEKSGQSIHVDDYLGEGNSLSRKIASDAMNTINRRMQNADGSNESRIWEQLVR